MEGGVIRRRNTGGIRARRARPSKGKAFPGRRLLCYRRWKVLTPKSAIRDRLVRYASGLRFPRLLALTLALFVLDLIVPDMIPFVDEILLGLISLLLATLKKR